MMTQPNRINEEDSEHLKLTVETSNQQSKPGSPSISSYLLAYAQDGHHPFVSIASSSKSSNILGKRSSHNTSMEQSLLLKYGEEESESIMEKTLLDEIFDRSPRKKKAEVHATTEIIEQHCSKRKQKISRKTSQQLQALERFFKTYNYPWPQDIVLKLAKQTGLSVTQVYKWGWDQRSKLVKRLKSRHSAEDNLLSVQASSIQNSILNDDMNQNKVLLQCIKPNTDEFGGYSKPKWQTTTAEEMQDLPLLDTRDDESLCKIVGIDIEQKLNELLFSISLSEEKQDQPNQKFEKSKLQFKALDLKRINDDRIDTKLQEISDEGRSEKFIQDYASTAANSSREMNSIDQNTLIQAISKIKQLDLCCNEEVVSLTQDLDDQLDQIGNDLRQKMFEFRKMRSTIMKHLQLQQQEPEATIQPPTPLKNSTQIPQCSQAYRVCKAQDLVNNAFDYATKSHEQTSPCPDSNNSQMFGRSTSISQLIVVDELINVGSQVRSPVEKCYEALSSQNQHHSHKE